MPSDPKSLDELSRDELIARARELGAVRPELLTRPELRDEIIRLSEVDERERQRARGWFGVARDLVASVVSQGLHLSDTAELIRGVSARVPKAGPPVATVTLAEIYAAQGHVARALALLDEVLEREPDHEAARQARQRFAPEVTKAVPVMPPEPEEDLAEGGAAEPEGSVVEEPVIVAKPASVEEAAIVVKPASVEVEPAAIDEHLLFLVVEEGRAPVCVWQLGRRRPVRLKPGTSASLAIKVVEILSSWDGPSCRESVHLIEGDRGRIELEPSTGQVRVVLGIVERGRFLPLSVGAQFAWSSGSGPALTWSPPVAGVPLDWAQAGRERLPLLLQAS